MSHSCLPLMPEVTRLAVHPISTASNPKVNEKVASPTFMIHMLDKSLLPYGHQCDCHMRYDLSNLTSSFISTQKVLF